MLSVTSKPWKVQGSRQQCQRCCANVSVQESNTLFRQVQHQEHQVQVAHWCCKSPLCNRVRKDARTNEYGLYGMIGYFALLLILFGNVHLRSFWSQRSVLPAWLARGYASCCLLLTCVAASLAVCAGDLLCAVATGFPLPLSQCMFILQQSSAQEKPYTLQVHIWKSQISICPFFFRVCPAEEGCRSDFAQPSGLKYGCGSWKNLYPERCAESEQQSTVWDTLSITKTYRSLCSE